MRSGPRLEDGEEINRQQDSSRQEKQEWGEDVVMGPCRAYARNKRHSWGAAMVAQWREAGATVRDDAGGGAAVRASTWAWRGEGWRVTGESEP